MYLVQIYVFRVSLLATGHFYLVFTMRIRKGKLHVATFSSCLLVTEYGKLFCGASLLGVRCECTWNAVAAVKKGCPQRGAETGERRNRMGRGLGLGLGQYAVDFSGYRIREVRSRWITAPHVKPVFPLCRHQLWRRRRVLWTVVAVVRVYLWSGSTSRDPPCAQSCRY